MAQAEASGGEDGLRTPTEASLELRVPVDTLTDWRYRGKGPEYVRVGRAIRYRRSALTRWLAANTVRPTRGA